MKTYTVEDLQRMTGKSSVKALTDQAKGTKSLQKVIRSTEATRLLRDLQLTGQGEERHARDPMSRAKARSLEVALRSGGVEASAAPDHDNTQTAWLYVDDQSTSAKRAQAQAKKSAKKAQAKKASAKKGSSGHRVPEWQIEALQQEAGAAGDHATVNTCKRALAGNAAAMRKVVEIIREAKRAS